MPGEERETKIYSAIVDALDSLASELEEHVKLLDLQREDYDTLADEVTDLQDSIYDLEEAIGADSEDDYDDRDMEDDDGEELAESYISMTCPSCAYSFYYKYEDGKENDKLVCPSCGEEFSRSL
jgi:formylmethanofuran dehydrogenase subunit E